MAPSGSRWSRGRPALCLPGLTRNGCDFHDLAVALSRNRVSPRTVYTLDYRGRGQSDWPEDYTTYQVGIEAKDA